MPKHLDRPETYARRVLLAVTGLSPQIVTETLFALAVKRKWIPTEIRIITTRQGAAIAQNALLTDDPGWFRQLRDDYGLPEIAFGADDIHIIKGPDGMPLDDILTDADNVAVADFITEHVRAITADPTTSLHVSIAGGRKTMGFYIGYALSLFGRPQDGLSHVLVSPPFESLPEFFYPAPHTRLIRDRSSQRLDAKTARVDLGEIPFVRLREGLPKSLFEGRLSFSAAITEAQKALPPLALGLEPGKRTVIAGGETFDLKPMEFAFYWMMAERCIDGRGGVHWSDPAIREELLAYYGRLVGVNSGLYEQTEKAYRHFNKDNFDPAKTHVPPRPPIARSQFAKRNRTDRSWRPDRSIFLTTGERARLLRDMAAVLVQAEDSFLLLRLDPRARVLTLGKAIKPTDAPYFYVT